MKVVIGIAGKPDSGKDTLAEETVRLAKADGHSAKLLVFSADILRPTIRAVNKALEKEKCPLQNLPIVAIDEALRIWGIDPVPENEERFLRALAHGFGAARKESIATERPECQMIAQVMVREDTFGKDALATAATNRAVADPAQLVTISGVRWLADERLIREIRRRCAVRDRLRGIPPQAAPRRDDPPGIRKQLILRNELLERDMRDRLRSILPPDPSLTPQEKESVEGLIACVFANVKDRFAWAKARGRDKNEAELTWDEFLRQDNAENEIYVEEIAARADAMILNIGTKTEYLGAIGELYRRSVKPLLEAA